MKPSKGSEDEYEKLKNHVKSLVVKKDEMEKKIQELKDYLNTTGVGISNPLVDKEGFPLQKVDLFKIRESRQQYHRLQTDYSLIMKEIEIQLPKLHQLKVVDKPVKKKDTKIIQEVKFVFKREPFLLVDEILKNSPATKSEIKVGDKIIQFGKIVKSDIKKHGLKLLSQFVMANENKKVSIFVLRNEKPLEITFVPQRWSGQGLLGFHVKPI